LRAGPKWAQAGWASPLRGPVCPPFDLAAIQVIYSPEARRHTSSHSPSAAEEQRREGHHLEEERVELVLMLTNSYFYALTIHEKGPKICMGSSTNESMSFGELYIFRDYSGKCEKNEF
jgi:hypothetical protein